MIERSAEIHAHTNEAYLKFGQKIITYEGVTYCPEELIEAAARSGLGALVITNHNTFFDVDRYYYLYNLASRYDVELVPGVEFSASETDATGKSRNPHISCMGFNPDKAYLIEELRYKRVDEIFDRIGLLEGITIAVHPKIWGGPIHLSASEIMRNHSYINAIEADTFWMHKQIFVEIAQIFEKEVVGGSDVHDIRQLEAVKYIYDEELGLVETIKNRKGRIERKNWLQKAYLAIPGLLFYLRLQHATRGNGNSG